MGCAVDSFTIMPHKPMFFTVILLINLLFIGGDFRRAEVAVDIMDKTARIMLDVIRNEICGEVTVKCAELTNELYSLSSGQDLTAIVGDGLRRCGLLSDDVISRSFKRAIYAAVCRCELQTAEITSVSEVFEANRIPFILLKGSVLRKLYPEPWMRTSCDVDILVKKSDLIRASELLTEKLKYVQKHSSPKDISFYSANRVHIELHFDLIENNRIGTSELLISNVWEHSIPINGGYEHQMTDEMFYYFHIVHMAKHVTTGGCGVRPFIDLWLLRSKEGFDALKAEVLVKDGKMSLFNDAVVCLSEVWFGDKKHNSLTLELQNYILSAGIYGNMENIAAINQAYYGGKFKSAINRIFMPYQSLKQYYPILYKQKWIFPFCQMHRLGSFLFNGRLKNGIYELKTNAKLTPKKRSTVASLLKQIGLE